MTPSKEKCKSYNPTQHQDRYQSINIYTMVIFYGIAYIYAEILSFMFLLEPQL
jgi:hypothetical protein